MQRRQPQPLATRRARSKSPFGPGGWPFGPRFALCWAASLELCGAERPRETLGWTGRGCRNRQKVEFLLDCGHRGPRLLWVLASGSSRDLLSISGEKSPEEKWQACERMACALVCCPGDHSVPLSLKCLEITGPTDSERKGIFPLLGAEGWRGRGRMGVS